LLPCPFCGAPAERIDFGIGSGENEGGSCIACTVCQHSGPIEFGYKENFISNWNRRALAARQPVGQTFQAGVAEWMGQCFLPSLYSNMTERGDRLLEEVLELLQAHGYDKARVPTLVDYVFGRPVGEPAQEVGGVMVTLAGYCWVAGLDMHAAGDAELARIGQPEVMAKIRAKQEAKNALHFDTPLPGNAAATAQQPAQVYLDGLDRALGETIDQRDRYHEIADDLAGHIAAITGVDIGEHSSANCPWQNAIEAAEEYKPAQAVDLGQLQRFAPHPENRAFGWMEGMREEASGDWLHIDDVRALIDSQAEVQS
ncbi:hypothetical protein, partial [Streptomyces sp. NPDC057020]|uniref:hypothetical protein n=1 Tax=Streptomyces sp. NPDC057020 TaxID=3346002 RepID=UPI0036D378DD